LPRKAGPLEVIAMVGKSYISAILGGGGFAKLLRDIEQRCGDAFSELGPGCLADFWHMVDCIDAFLDLLDDPKTKLEVTYSFTLKTSSDVFEFCRYYAGWLGHPLAKRLEAEINELLEAAIDRAVGKTWSL